MLESTLREPAAAESEDALGKGLSPWVMVQSLEAWRVLEAAGPEEVDEFTKAVLEIRYGVERVERVEGWCFGHRKGR